MRTVYVIQDSPGKNLLPAERFGKIKVLLTATDSHRGATHMSEKLARGLVDVEPQDYLLLIGDPIAIGLATHIALQKTHGMIFALKWDRVKYRYNVELMEIEL